MENEDHDLVPLDAEHMRWVPCVSIDKSVDWSEYGIIISYGWTAVLTDEQVAQTEEGVRMQSDLHIGLSQAKQLRDKLNEIIPQVEAMGVPPENTEHKRIAKEFSNAMHYLSEKQEKKMTILECVEKVRRDAADLGMEIKE